MAGNPEAFLPGTVGANSVLRGLGDLPNPSLRVALSNGSTGTQPAPASTQTQSSATAAAGQPVTRTNRTFDPAWRAHMYEYGGTLGLSEYPATGIPRPNIEGDRGAVANNRWWEGITALPAEVTAGAPQATQATQATQPAAPLQFTPSEIAQASGGTLGELLLVANGRRQLTRPY